MLDHILIRVDGSFGGDCALSHAISIAKAVSGQITVLSIVEQPVTTAAWQLVDPLTWQINRTETEAQLDKAVTQLESMNLTVNKAVLETDQADPLIAFAQEHGVNLIIAEANEGLSTSFQQSLLRSTIPTLLVPPDKTQRLELTPIQYKKFLVPLDGSKRAECVLPLATTLAAACHAQLILTHVVRKPEMPRRASLTQDDIELSERVVERNREEVTEYLEQLETRLAATLDVKSQVLIQDSIVRALHQFIDQEQIDLTFLSAHGYSGEPEWPYGSITGSLVTHSTKAVLVVQDLPSVTISEVGVSAPRESRGR